MSLEVHLQQPSQLAVPVVDVFSAVLVAQCINAVSQSQQGAVDVSTLLQPLTPVLSLKHAHTRTHFTDLTDISRLSKNVAFSAPDQKMAAPASFDLNRQKSTESCLITGGDKQPVFLP